jgi:hypothetical protein
METKPRTQTGKPEAAKPSEKQVKGATETGRLFLDVEQASRRSQTVPLTRYVE